MAGPVQFCTPDDLLLYAINPNALQSISLAQQNAACLAASSEALGYLVDRYPQPYGTPYPPVLVMHTAKIAVYYLFGSRGYQPDAGADNRIRDEYYAATYNPTTGVLGWLSRVKRQEINIPDLVFTPPTANGPYSLPAVLTGGPRGAPIRGWTGRHGVS